MKIGSELTHSLFSCQIHQNYLAYHKFNSSLPIGFNLDWGSPCKSKTFQANSKFVYATVQQFVIFSLYMK